MAGLNNNHISSITITDGDKPTSVGEASRSEDQEGPVIVSSLLNLMHEHKLNSPKKVERSVFPPIYKPKAKGSSKDVVSVTKTCVRQLLTNVTI